MMAKPGKVVQKAINDSAVGNELSVYGVKMNVFRVLSRILPHRWLMKLSTKM